jgi:hypothetical protein
MCPGTPFSEKKNAAQLNDVVMLFLFKKTKAE